MKTLFFSTYKKCVQEFHIGNNAIIEQGEFKIVLLENGKIVLWHKDQTVAMIFPFSIASKYDNNKLALAIQQILLGNTEPIEGIIKN